MKHLILYYFNISRCKGCDLKLPKVALQNQKKTYLYVYTNEEPRVQIPNSKFKSL